MCHAAQPHSCSQSGNTTCLPAAYRRRTQVSPQCRAHGTHDAPSHALCMADSNKGSHYNLQHSGCSPPQWWPARYQHYPSAVHKVLCAETVATIVQPAHAVHYCTVLCCCLEHWNSLPPHNHLQRSCSAAAPRGCPLYWAVPKHDHPNYDHCKVHPSTVNNVHLHTIAESILMHSNTHVNH